MTVKIIVHETGHAIAIAPHPVLMMRTPDCFITAPFYAVGDPEPSPLELLACFLAGPCVDYLSQGGTDMGEFVADLYDKAITCEAREDPAKAAALMEQLTPAEIGHALAHAERSARLALRIYRTNLPGITALSDMIEKHAYGHGVIVTEEDLIELERGRTPMFRQIVDFD